MTPPVGQQFDAASRVELVCDDKRANVRLSSAQCLLLVPRGCERLSKTCKLLLFSSHCTHTHSSVDDSLKEALKDECSQDITPSSVTCPLPENGTMSALFQPLADKCMSGPDYSVILPAQVLSVTKGEAVETASLKMCTYPLSVTYI